MVRSEDPPGLQKHIRLGKYTELLLLAIKEFPGVKTVVLHTHGLKGEHPHLHVWWSSDKPVTNQTVRNRLKACNAIFANMSGQNDWSIRNHDSYETWAAYVQRNKTHKVLHGEVPPIIQHEPDVIPTPKTPIIAAPVRVKKLTAEERLMRYCLVEEGFTYKQWGLAHYELGSPYREKMYEQVSKALITYANGRLDNRQMTYMGRNIIWTFADEDLRDALTRNWSAEAKKFW